jgi:hypothetical protein
MSAAIQAKPKSGSVLSYPQLLACLTTAWTGPVWLSSEQIRELLERNHGNRPVRKSHVDWLANLIRSGEWVTNHPQPIVFGESGRLLDGQHRLMAMAMVDGMYVVNVVTMVPDDVFSTIDRGVSKSTADVLQFHEQRECNRKLMALLRFCLSNDVPEQGDVSHYRFFCNNDFYKKFEQVRQSALFVIDSTRSQRVGIGSVSFHYALLQYHQIDPDKATEFVQGVYNIDTDVKHAMQLRTFLASNQFSRGGTLSLYSGSWPYIVGAMQKHLENEPLTRFTKTAWREQYMKRLHRRPRFTV